MDSFSSLQNSNSQDSLKGKDFDKLIDESFDNQLYNTDKIRQGELVEGKVLSVTTKDVFLDIGVKMQGVIPSSEFPAAEMPKKNDEIQAVVIRRDTDSVLLSYTKAKEHEALEILRNNFKNNIPILGSVKEIVPGGFTVIILNSFHSFVPISQIDTELVTEDTMKNYVGNSYEFLIQTLFKNRQLNPVLSRKQLLTSQVHQEREKFFKEKKENDIVEGVVKNYTSFGLFIDLGGFDGLLHVSDLSWSRHTRPSSVAAIGEKLKLKIIKLDPHSKKINLSLKELLENPWDTIEDRYKEGTIIKGEVIKVLPYGAFIHLEDSVEGFVHISEMSWLKRIAHPKEIISLNEIIECKVLSIDKDQKRISLGIKQVIKNPWSDVDSMYPIGLTVKVVVTKTTKSGAIVEFKEGFVGFIPLLEYAWNKKSKPKLKIGEEIEAKVISHSIPRREIKLSIRQLSEDPWNTLGSITDTVVEGIITNVTNFGVFVQINGNIEGLIPKNYCYNPDENSSFEEVQSKFELGKTIQVFVKELNLTTKRLILSVRDLKKMSTKQEMDKHMINTDDNPHLFSLGDMLNKTDEKKE